MADNSTLWCSLHPLGPQPHGAFHEVNLPVPVDRETPRPGPPPMVPCRRPYPSRAAARLDQVSVELPPPYGRARTRNCTGGARHWILILAHQSAGSWPAIVVTIEASTVSSCLDPCYAACYCVWTVLAARAFPIRGTGLRDDPLRTGTNIH